jgi:hypothetical protein
VVSRRRVLRTGALALAGAVAGCGGDGGSDGGATEDGGTEGGAMDGGTTVREGGGGDTSTEMAESTAGESGNGETSTETVESTPASSVVEIPSYEFTAGESYTYDTLLRQDGTRESTETWAVTSVDGDDVTVEVTSTVDGEATTKTVSGTHETIYDKVDEALFFNWFAIARAPLRVAEMGELTAGNSYTISVSQFPNPEDINWSTATVDVSGDTSVNGVTCTEFTLEPDGIDQVQTACVADNYPFAVSLHQERSGTTVLDLNLTDVTRP